MFNVKPDQYGSIRSAYTAGYETAGTALTENQLLTRAKEVRRWMYDNPQTSLNIYAFVYGDGEAWYSAKQACYGSLEPNWRHRAAHFGKRVEPFSFPIYFVSQPATRQFRKGGPTPKESDIFYLDWLLNRSMFSSLYLGVEKSIATTVRKGLIYDMRTASAQRVIIADGAVRMVNEHTQFSGTFMHLCQYFTEPAAWLLSFFHFKNGASWTQYACSGHTAFTAYELRTTGARAILDQTWAADRRKPFSEDPNYNGRTSLLNEVNNGRMQSINPTTKYPKVAYKKQSSYWEQALVITDDCIKDHCIEWLKDNAGEKYAEQHTL